MLNPNAVLYYFCTQWYYPLILYSIVLIYTCIENWLGLIFNRNKICHNHKPMQPMTIKHFIALSRATSVAFQTYYKNIIVTISEQLLYCCIMNCCVVHMLCHWQHLIINFFLQQLCHCCSRDIKFYFPEF